MLRKSNYKDLTKWRETKRRQKRRYYGKTQNAKNSKMLWTQEDIKMIMNSTMTDSELSKLLGRSVASIQNKRYKQKKLLKEKGSTK